ncbi:MAG: putative Se/S carrier-like protein [Desulfomonilia bacterium]
MGIPPEQAFGTIRVSLGWENTQREIERTARTLEKLVTALKGFSEDSSKEHLGVITFPSRRDAVRTARILGQNSISHAVICRPKELRNTSGTHIAIAYRLGEKDRIGNLLGTAGIEFSGMHVLKTLCRDRSGKEEAFWKKVKEIQLKKRGE